MREAPGGCGPVAWDGGPVKGRNETARSRLGRGGRGRGLSSLEDGLDRATGRIQGQVPTRAKRPLAAPRQRHGLMRRDITAIEMGLTGPATESSRFDRSVCSRPAWRVAKVTRHRLRRPRTPPPPPPPPPPTKASMRVAGIAANNVPATLCSKRPDPKPDPCEKTPTRCRTSASLPLSIECEPCGRRPLQRRHALMEQVRRREAARSCAVLASCPKAAIAHSIHDRCRVRYGADSPASFRDCGVLPRPGPAWHTSQRPGTPDFRPHEEP